MDIEILGDEIETSDPLADIAQEGFLGEQDEQETETPADSPVENNQTEESSSQEEEESEEVVISEEEETPDASKNVPFHKHPRWQEMQEENKSLQAKLEELSPLAEKVSQMETKILEDKGTEVPSEYKEVFGDNVDAFNNWQKLQSLQEQKIKKDILAEMEESKQAKAQEDRKQSEAIQANIVDIEDKFDVKLPEKSSLRNEYLKFMWDYKPTNDTGNLDFKKGWTLFERTREVKVDTASIARKKVIKKTVSDRKAEATVSDTYELGNILPSQFK